MDLEDHYVTATPEGVSLDLVLAGLGSRCGAYALDLLIQAAAFGIAVAIVLNVVGVGDQTSALVSAGILSCFGLIDFFGYFVVCEMLWSGRSVGKVAAGTRVVRVGGGPVGFWSSLLRNLARLVDMTPFPYYLVGSILVLATSRNQRLGDLLGNTLVVRVRHAAVRLDRRVPLGSMEQWRSPASIGYGYPPSSAAIPWGAPALPPELAHWDVTAVNPQELALVQAFLANRWGYTPEARMRLALQLAERLWPKVAGPTEAPHPEQFLEAVALVKAVRG